MPGGKGLSATTMYRGETQHDQGDVMRYYMQLWRKSGGWIDSPKDSVKILKYRRKTGGGRWASKSGNAGKHFSVAPLR